MNSRQRPEEWQAASAVLPEAIQVIGRSIDFVSGINEYQTGI